MRIHDPGNKARVRGRRLLQFVLPYSGKLFQVFALTLISTALALSYPLLAKLFVDGALAKKNSHLLVTVTFALTALVVLNFTIGALTRYLSTSYSIQILSDMRLFLFRHLQSLSLRFYTNTKMGEILSRLNSDVAEIQAIATDAVFSLALSILTLLGTAVLLLWLNSKLFCLCCLFIPFSVRGLAHYRSRITQQARAVRERNADFSSTLLESLTGMKFIKSVGAEQAEADKLTRQNQVYITTLLRYQITSSLGQAVPAIFLSLSTIAVLLYGGHLVIGGAMTLGSLVAFAAYQGRVLSPIQSIMGLYLSLQRAKVSLDRVFEFLDLRPEVEESPGALELPVVRGNIEFLDVAFSYDIPYTVLRHVNVAIPAGARIGIVGPTGAGKSTFVDLLLRFYDPQEGSILLDGNNLRELKFKTLRQNIAVITHDPYLFHATIEENIRYASWQATDEEVRSAARVAEIHEFIRTLPNGYATVVGEKGTRLSAGQRQRIAIARAILRQASVWVFDEATATLDVLTESRIQESLDFWLRGRTSIVVSHRLSSMRHVEKILVLDSGEVVQVGTHSELLQTDGLYKQLYLTASARKQETVLSPR